MKQTRVNLDRNSGPRRVKSQCNSTAKVRTEQGKLRLLVGIDRTSKFAFVRTVQSAGKTEAAQFLRELIKAVPYRVHTVLTDNGIQFTNRARDAYNSQHIFDRVCDKHGIKHRLTKVNHPWINGQVECMNRTIKDATVKRYHYDTHDQLRTHLQLFVDAYNHARRLKTLRGLTPPSSSIKPGRKSHSASGSTRCTFLQDQTPSTGGAGRVHRALQGGGAVERRPRPVAGRVRLAADGDARGGRSDAGGFVRGLRGPGSGG